MWKSSAGSLWNECHDDDNKGVNGPIFLVLIYAVTEKECQKKKEKKDRNKNRHETQTNQENIFTHLTSHK